MEELIELGGGNSDTNCNALGYENRKYQPLWYYQDLEVEKCQRKELEQERVWSYDVAKIKGAEVAIKGVQSNFL